MALAEVPGASDGTPVRFEVVRPDGSLLGLVGSSRGGHAAVPVRLDLPPACARPGRHVFELTACVPGWGGPGTGPARVEVIAARFSFGL